ncbi:YbaN family protein [Devosia honganensis]|uniref:YbaN family protein n=1 Tax=Devosia honganensis TaxID=1610527 RepID=A0ABV7WYN0_9HYPH
MNATKRHLLTAVGIVMVGLAAAGAVLPLLPTTPFLLVAVACFSRSFPRLERWLLEHPKFGPPLENWRRSGAISSKAKWCAVLAMLGSYVILLMTTDFSPWIRAAVALVLACCAIFIMTRPAPVSGWPAGKDHSTSSAGNRA